LSKIKVYDIVSVNVFYQQSTGNYRVDAVGRVSTGGYSDPQLVSQGGVVANGTLDFDFMATPPPPHTMTTQAFVTFKASAIFGGPGTDLKGLTSVRVFATTNSGSARFPPE
jgi:hypothetical protein